MDVAAGCGDKSGAADVNLKFSTGTEVQGKMGTKS